jgi:hypothetical protein
MGDEWCDLCREKLKAARVIFKGREIGVCKHCESLTPLSCRIHKDDEKGYKS